MSNLKQQVLHYARQTAGSHKTVHDRTVILTRFTGYLKQRNIQIKSLKQITTRHIQGYIQQRQAQGITSRTLQNEMATIRQTLRMAGRDKLGDSPALSNKELSIGNASRVGTKTAITDRKYQGINQKALSHKAGLTATHEIARTFGLRGEEAVQSIHSLKTWQTVLQREDSKIKVVFGTKGGRPRKTIILDQQRASNAITNAIKIEEKQSSKLIDKPSLKQAMTYWRNHTSALGLTGQLSPHSLRYAWAQEAIQYYQHEGYTQKEALALTSMDLEHGNERGRYIKRLTSSIYEEL